jgi:hypothetical protein
MVLIPFRNLVPNLHLMLKDGEANPVPKKAVHTHRFGTSFDDIAPWLYKILRRDADRKIEAPGRILRAYFVFH